jgi:hypothetical protein
MSLLHNTSFPVNLKYLYLTSPQKPAFKFGFKADILPPDMSCYPPKHFQSNYSVGLSNSQTMLDAGSFDPSGEAASDFLGKLQRDLLAEKGCHLLSLHRLDSLS